MSAQNLNKNIYPSDELKPLIEPPVFQVSLNAPTLFSYINDGELIEIVAVGINETGWVTKHGTPVSHKPELPEYIYYMLTEDYRSAYKNTVIQMKNEERMQVNKQERTLAFMQIHRQDITNSRLGCIQGLFILWSVILLAGIVGALILMHHQGLF
jgi:hypothetical protein